MSRALVGTLFTLIIASVGGGLHKTTVASAAAQHESYCNPNNYRINVTCDKCVGKFASYAPDVATSLKRINEIESSQCFKNFLAKGYKDNKIVELQKTKDRPGYKECKDPQPTTSNMTIDEVYKDLTTVNLDLVMTVESHGIFRTNCGKEGRPDSDTFSVRDSSACWGGYTIQKRASLIAHEVTHKLGYRHCQNDTNSEDNVSNMPYLVQNAIEACWNQPITPADSTPIPQNTTPSP